MNDDVAIKIDGLTKIYKIFDRPFDRVKEALNPFHKRYSRDFYALNDVSFEIKKGETVGIIGKNGAGKSTLLKIITGVLTPTKGTVEVNGRIASLLELGAGFNPEMTGIENIYMNGSVMGYDKKAMDEKLDAIIDFADIGDFIYQPVKMYSSGMFARLAFAMNSTLEPDVLIVDEALAVGDMAFQIKCMDKMESLMKGGCTVIFVSHDINAVRRLCQKAIFLNRGEIVSYGDVENTTISYLEFIKGKKLLENQNYATAKNEIGEICSVTVTDNSFIEKNVFRYNEPLKITVRYNVRDGNLKDVVLGIALFSSDNKYLCGMNTLLDNIKIPWETGMNEFTLDCPLGPLVLDGMYYFDVAIEDKTATVPIHYLQAVKSIKVISEYMAEGVYVIPHKWGKAL